MKVRIMVSVGVGVIGLLGRQNMRVLKTSVYRNGLTDLRSIGPSVYNGTSGL